MSTNEQVADFAAETYPSYSQELHHSYIEGYNPVSLAAPHSSLLRNSTWIGMGLLLSFFPSPAPSFGESARVFGMMALPPITPLF